MRREGRQPGAGRAFSKPTNHSKYTGKCRKVRCACCHSLPVSKSLDKVKGAYKLKSSDVALNHRLASWRVVDRGMLSNYMGVSASRILDHMSNHDFWDDEDDEDQAGCDAGGGYQDLVAAGSLVDNLLIGCCDGSDVEEEEEEGEAEGSTSIDRGQDDDMDFYEVGFAMEYVDGEDWCVVREM